MTLVVRDRPSSSDEERLEGDTETPTTIVSTTTNMSIPVVRVGIYSYASLVPTAIKYRIMNGIAAMPRPRAMHPSIR